MLNREEKSNKISLLLIIQSFYLLSLAPKTNPFHKLSKIYLKGSYDVAKKNIILCIWCNAMCLRGSRFKKHIIFHILYIIVAPLCSAFLKHADFYKAHHSEKWGVLWLASYQVRCDWPNTSSMWWKCYAPLPCWDAVSRRDDTKTIKTHYKRGICCIQWGHNYWL